MPTIGSGLRIVEIIMDIVHFSEIQADQEALVGGKGLSLGLMTQAGLPVPAGFVVTTQAYRNSPQLMMKPSLEKVIIEAYQKLGGGAVAVRSSATGEDGAETSFAGQQETILGVEGEADLLSAISRCWKSLGSERAKAYRQRQGIADESVSMAVVVQKLIDAEVAGVMFTTDPLDATGQAMRIEASWGLGETVVSGRVTPDRFQIHRETLAILSQQIARKEILRTRQEEKPVPPELQNTLCLSEAQVKVIAELGLKVQNFYQAPRDIEWGWAEGQCWLLQARPITTTSASEREQIRTTLINRLKQIADGKLVCWAKCNLIEILAEPTPLTWSLVSELLLSAGGGTGKMYRDVGYIPDPRLQEQSAYDLIGGRPYMNLEREPRLQSAKPLFGYPIEKYKAEPNRALNPEVDTSRPLSGAWGWFRLPSFLLGQAKIAKRIGNLSKTFAEEFRERILPQFVQQVESALAQNYSAMPLKELVSLFHQWSQKVLVDFAGESLKPTLLAQYSWKVLEAQLNRSVGAEKSMALLAQFSQGAKPPSDADLALGLRKLFSGQMTETEFLKHFGHRAANEMELSSPRWNEDPSQLRRLIQPQNPTEETSVDPQTRWQELAQEAQIPSYLMTPLGKHALQLHTMISLREFGKHILMKGYALLRRMALAIDHAAQLNGGVFFLSRQELTRLENENLGGLISQRKSQRLIELSLEIPAVIFSDALEVIGQSQPVPLGAESLTGIPLSAGVAEGPALVLTEPKTQIEIEPGYILVCPSTDPAWVPLFLHAKGLVMDNGGTLSHGAIVAREFHLPAVAGLPDFHKKIQTGQRLRIDGGRGLVAVLRD
jgi:pyruvate,water dikinase